MLKAIRHHWPEYLMESAGLSVFMISAGLFTTLLEYPASPVHQSIHLEFGLSEGALFFLFITFEAPISGMSMNPARSLASALPGGLWEGIRIYLNAAKR